MEELEIYIEDTNGFKFFVRKYLPSIATKGLIILLHDISDHSGRYDFVGDNFCENGFIFFAADLRGNGNSKGKRGTFSDINEALTDIDFIIDSAKNEFPNIPTFIFSQGMGANLALTYILNKSTKIDGIIGCSPFLKSAKQKNVVSKMFKNISTNVVPWWKQSTGITGKMLTNNLAFAEAYDKDKNVHGKISLNTLKMLEISGSTIISNAGLIDTPTLLLHSTKDEIADYNSTVEFFTNSNINVELRSFNELQHEVFHENNYPFVLNDIINWTLTQISKKNQVFK